MTEYWDCYDKDRNLMDRQLIRGEAIPEGCYHLVIHLSIFNTKGQLLSQKRTADRQSFPGMWDVSVGGSALAGETSQQAVSRELREELGLNIDFTGVDPAFSQRDEQLFDDHYVLITDGISLDMLTLDPVEVQEVAWYNEPQIRKMVKKNQFINWKFLNRLFTARNQLLTYIRKQQEEAAKAQQTK